MSVHRKTLFICSIFLISLFFSACGKSNPDGDYYVGLKMLSEGKEDEARAKFKHCIKKGSYYCARESAIALTTFGSIQEKNTACKNLIKSYKDPETIYIAAKQFNAAKEFGLVIESTYGLDYEKENNELLKIRLECLKERDNSHFNQEVYKWFTSRPISEFHYKFYRDTLYQEKSAEELTPQEFAITYRIDLYKRNYLLAFENAFILFDYFDQKLLEPLPQLISDIGKGFLYGNDEFAANAQLFCDKATEFVGTDAEFYFWFYAGRLFVKAGYYSKLAQNCFENAIACTDITSRKDNALWYLLDCSLSISVDEAINKLEQNIDKWTSPTYFDDFFEKLVPVMLEKGRWKQFGSLLNLIDGKASNEVTAKISYLYGRLLQEGYAVSSDRDGETQRAFERAVNSGGDEYYRIAAAYKLGYRGRVLEKTLAVWSELNQPLVEKNEDLEKFLRGFAVYGLPEKIYPMWQRFFEKGISTDTSMYLADFLHKCGNQNNKYNLQSIRIASKAGSKSERPLTIDELKLIYPKNFSEYVDIYSKKYDINSSVIYALIRSESFFDDEVISSAGAIGLTQLMEFTAGDIARKLKKQNYSLTDAETNIEFGTFYLAELVKRCNDSTLQALLSYNAGITRVRRWLSGSMIEFGKKQSMSGDLFLETVPYEETRNYGKKLMPATVMYEYLYSNKDSFYTIVQSFIR